MIVVGAGITGAGIAREAALAGLSVLLVDKNDIASGTSSRSSKLVHGGLRYLEHYQFGMVFESVHERGVLRHIAPHLVKPQGFLFPVYQHSRHKLTTIRAGMWLYDALALFRSPRTHEHLTPRHLQTREPALGQKGLRGAPLYFDCATDDARLTLENAMDASVLGADILTYSEVKELVREDGRVRGVRLKSTIDANERDIHADIVVSALGPWSDSIRQGRARMRPTKGVHIVVDKKKLPLNNAVVCFHPDDGRVLFAIPWNERTYIGTTDTDFDSSVDEVWATREDVDYLLRAATTYFPEHSLSGDDVIATWAALRPLLDDGAGDESAVSREHEVWVERDGLVVIAGGKLTTYRKMAADAMGVVRDQLLARGHRAFEMARISTSRLLPGGYELSDAAKLLERTRRIFVDANVEQAKEKASFLVGLYGANAPKVANMAVSSDGGAELLNPDRGEILAQVDFAVAEEMAVSLCDVLIRRMPLYFRAEDQGLGVAEKVASRMQLLLGWTEQRRVNELNRYRDEVAKSRRWRDD